MHRAGSLEQELAAAKHMVATLSMDLTDIQRDLHAVTKAKVGPSFLPPPPYASTVTQGL